MPANERSLDDQLVPTTRKRRRRLLTHGIVFASAGLLATTLAPSTTSAAPTVQDGRFLAADSVAVSYSCTGSDQLTNDLLTSFGLNPFAQNAIVTSAAVEPAPSPAEDFDVEFTWNFDLDLSVVSFAVGLGVTTFTIQDAVNPISATTGATGSSAGTGAADELLVLGDGTTPVGYVNGPYTGTFNRTADVDSPIEFTPGTITTTVLTSSNVSLGITCTPGAGVLSMLDETGVAPSTTTTTRPAVVVPTTAAPVAVGSGDLPRTGASSTLYLTLLALGLIDLGYLAMTAGRPARRRASSAR